MDTLKDFWRTSWLNVIAFGMFLMPVGRYITAGEWLDLLPLPILSFVGLIFFVANELVSETMPEVPRFRFESVQLFQSPTFVKIGGAVMLLAAAFATFQL